MPSTVWALAAGNLVNQFGSFLPLFLVLCLLSRHYSPAISGLAIALLGFGSLPASVVGGYLVDRVGSRRLLVGSMVIAGLSAILLAVTSNVLLTIASITTYGLFSPMYRPALVSLLASSVPAERRVLAAALIRLGFNVGAMGGPAVAGVLAQSSFTLVFVLDGLTCLAFAAVAALIIEEPPVAPPSTTALRGYGRVVEDRGFMVFCIGFMLMMTVYVQSTTTVPLQLHGLGLTSATYGVLMSLNGLLVVIFEVPAASRIRHLPPRRVMAVGAVLVGLGLGLTGLHDLVTVVASVVVWTLGEMLVFSMSIAYVAAVAPPQLTGRYQGVFGLCSGIGRAAGPVLGAQLFVGGGALLWVALAMLGLVSAILIAQAQPRWEAGRLTSAIAQ